MSVALFTLFFIVFPIAGGVTLATLESKRLGREWKKSSNNLTLSKDNLEITFKGNEKVYSFYEPKGYYVIRKKLNQNKYTITCSWSKATSPFLTYEYDPITDTTKYEKLKLRNLSGIKGYIMMKKEQIDDGIEEIKRQLNEKARGIEKEESSEHESEYAKNIKSGRFLWKDIENGVEFEMDSYCAYQYIRNEETETIKLKWNDEIVYSLSRDVKNNKVHHFYIESNELKNIKDINLFTKNEEKVWKEIKRAIQVQNKKRADIQNLFEGKEVSNQIENEHDTWTARKKKWTERQKLLLTYKEWMTETDRWYLEENFPTRVIQIEEMVKKWNEIPEQTLDKIEMSIINRMKEIQENVNSRFEKEMKRTTMLVERD